MLVLEQDKFEEELESAVREPRTLSATANSANQGLSAVEKQALRDLLDSFQEEPETLLERTLRDPATRHHIGKVIGYTIVKPYEGEQ